MHFRHIGCLYAGDGFGRTGLLPGQFQRSLRNECVGAHCTGGTSAETLSRISFPARPRRSFIHARYRFHDGRDGHFPPFAPTDGSRRHARAGIPLAGMDRLADGRCHVRRTAGRLACPMDEHECAEKVERQADTSQNQCREPLGGILAGHSRDESLQPAGRPLCPPARCFCGTAPCLYPSGSHAGAFRAAEHYIGAGRTDPDGAVRNLPAVGRRTLAARLRAVPRGRLARVRPADFGADQLCGVPLLLHCRRAYSHADERAGDGRRTAGAGHRRHPVRACVVRLSGQEGASGRFHRVSEKHADGSRRSFGEREKYGDETLRPILRPAAGACPFR